MVERSYDPKAVEARAQAVWKRTGGRAAAIAAVKGAKRFYFLDGPPYTSGHIHLGTGWNKVLKDAFVRYVRMQGHDVRDQPGWDMHGLPIEVLVERKEGIKNKREIEAMGVERFVNTCREFALQYLQAMTEEFRQLGVWFDWDRPYRTIDPSYIEGAWHAIHAANEKGLLVQADRVLSWCPRCETALAEAELEYWDEEDPSVYLTFPTDQGELLVWTTTPWTLPANVAVAAHTEVEYAVADYTMRDGTHRTFILAADLVEEIQNQLKARDATVIRTLPGRELEGLRYQHPLAAEVPYHRDDAGNRNRVIVGTHVTVERTGLVHTATGHGVEDQEAGARYGIGPFSIVGPDGRYNDQAGALQGLTTAEANEKVPAILHDRGALLLRGKVTHRYGHCWRCKTPILFRATRQWFIRITQVRDKMLREIERVRWTPAWAGSARQRDWVENARDWCITRQRYWGIPLPVWTCTGGHHTVVESRADLHRLSGTRVDDPHRPWVDQVTFPCPQCAQTATREPDVLDVWFDSACAAWASLGPSDEGWFPARLIIEGLDQTRGWFYSQLAAGVVAFDRCPYDEVVMHGFVHDREGRPMSKSLGNVITPGQVIEQTGVDALRLSLLGTAPWDDLHYGPDLARDAQRALNLLWNVHQFHLTYRGLDQWTTARQGRAREEDQWLRSRLQGLTTDVTDAMETREIHRATRALREFITEDLSRWYVRLVRARAWKGPDEDRDAVHATLHDALLCTATLLAPYAPHMAEAIHEDLVRDGSVHARRWPAADAKERNTQLESDMALVRQIVEAAASVRGEANVPLRRPAPKLVVTGPPTLASAVAGLQRTLKEQCNVKAAEYAGEGWGELKVAAVPVPKTIGPAFKGKAQTVIDAIKRADGEAIQAEFRTRGRATVDGAEITPDMVAFRSDLPEGIRGAPLTDGSVYLDLHMTDDLKAEGLAREIIRRVQVARQESDLELEEQADAEVQLEPAWASALEPFVAMIEEDTRCLLRIEPPGKPLRGGTVFDLKDYGRVGIALRRRV